MESHTFLEWLSSEAAAVCCALLKLYEQRDQMAFIDGPRIERDYMQKVGEYEETVIKEEIEAELLKKKKQLVQAAINRREPIDESSIDEEIDRQRRKILKEAAGSEINERKELDADQANELNSGTSRPYRNPPYAFSESAGRLPETGSSRPAAYS